MHLDFNERVPLLISLGSVFTIDETVLAYFGLDARIMDILRLFPKKPHDFGLLSYRASVRLHYTKGRIIVAILPITPGQNYTPTSAALAIMDLLADAVRHVPHYVMDSAFATEELFSEVQWREVAVSLSLKENRTAGFGPLYELVTEDLPLGETRTYAVNNVVIQAQNKKSAKSQGDDTGHLHVVLSTGWRTPVSHSTALKRVGEYKDVQDLYLAWPLSTLRILLKFDVPAGTRVSARDMLLERTGWNVLAPPPNAAGVEDWSEEALMELPAKILADNFARAGPHRPEEQQEQAGSGAQHPGGASEGWFALRSRPQEERSRRAMLSLSARRWARRRLRAAASSTSTAPNMARSMRLTKRSTALSRSTATAPGPSCWASRCCTLC